MLLGRYLCRVRMNRTQCISCRSESLAEILDLGMHPFADRFVPADRAYTCDKLFPLVCDLCETCGLVQSRTKTDPHDRYAEYSYTSSNSATTRRHWDEFARDVHEIVGLKKDALVVEAGSNDGYLCAVFQERGFRVIGVDPSVEMAALATARGVRTMGEFFAAGAASRILSEQGRPDLVVANNVLNHADELREFVEAAWAILSERGTFVFQVPYWRRIVESRNFDQVYHEHVAYFTVTAAWRLLQQLGMQVTRVDEVDFHGRSLRVFAERGSVVEPPRPVAAMMRDEADILEPHAYVAIRAHVVAARRALLRRLYSYEGGRPLVCAGASAKGNTFLNWHRLDHSVVSCVTDISPTKIGKLTPGSRIPIVHDEELAHMESPRVLVTTWNLASVLREAMLKINPNVEFINPYEASCDTAK